MIMKIVFIADIHFGPSKDNENIYRSLVECVYPYIQSHFVDLIVIGGDDTDDRMSLDQSATRYYLQFWRDITSFKRPDGSPVPVRAISGTESHQKGQLQSLQFLIGDPNVDLKTYETVGVENFDGCKILYVPEESVYNKYEYYKDTVFSNQKFDLVFGHGMFDFIGNNGWGDLQERSLKGSPIWNESDFKNVKGGVYFGHIHIAQNHKNRIYYSGSLTRFCQGEDPMKGFLSINYDTESHNHAVDFIPNPIAPRLCTISIENNETRPVDEIVSNLVAMREKMCASELRVMVDKHLIDLSKLQILRKYFQNNRELGIRIEVKKDKIAPEMTPGGVSSSCGTQLPQESIDALAIRHPTITDPLDWESNTIAYAKDTYGIDISREDMMDIIGKCMQM